MNKGILTHDRGLISTYFGKCISLLDWLKLCINTWGSVSSDIQHLKFSQKCSVCYSLLLFIFQLSSSCWKIVSGCPTPLISYKQLHYVALCTWSTAACTYAKLLEGRPARGGGYHHHFSPAKLGQPRQCFRVELNINTYPHKKTTQSLATQNAEWRFLERNELKHTGMLSLSITDFAD